MNKKTFYLLILLFILITVFSIKFYKTKKTQAMREYSNFILFEKKVKEINYLKNSLSNPDNLKKLLSFCKFSDSFEKILISCDNLNKNKFYRLQNILFKSNYKINRYTIIKNKDKVSLKVEILK
jgi:hypothetical protein